MTTAESTMLGRLKLIRQELGLTQREFASGANIAHGSVMNMETNRQSITDKTIRKICGTYSVNERWLRTGEGRMFVDARLDAFEQFTAAFNLDSQQQQHIAEYIHFPLDRLEAVETTNAAKRNVARLVKAIERGSVGRV